MRKCPACGSSRVYLSRLRSPLERIHQFFTEKQPYRCHSCGWRRWRTVEIGGGGEPDTAPEDLRTGRGGVPVTEDDLERLDPGQT